MYGVIGIRLIVATGSNRSSRPHPWCARITGLHERFGFAREFIKGIHDYAYATRKGKNTYVYFHMPPGLYELYYPISWRHEERYFVCVDEQGDLHTITRDEVLECLTNMD